MMVKDVKGLFELRGERAEVREGESASRRETARVLLAHAGEIHHAWQHDEQEIPSLLSYITLVSDAPRWEKEIQRDTGDLLLVFGGRIPEQGPAHLLKLFGTREKATDVLITESAASAGQNPLAMDADELADVLRLRGWRGEIAADLIAQNTGEQGAALVQHLASRAKLPQTLVVAASIDHIGRITASFIDALDYMHVTEKIRIIPLSLGTWSDAYKNMCTYADLAFGKEGEGELRTDQEKLFAKMSGQYTFRWQRALRAKREGKYEGRTMVIPSRALQVIEEGRKDA